MTSLIIDVHSHPLAAEYVDVLTGGNGLGGGKGREADGLTLPSWSLDQHLAVMEEHGIGTCVLSCPGLADLLTGSEGRKTARLLNEKLADMVAGHPSRFGAFAVVPMDDMDAANEELAYALDQLKLDGVCASPQRGGVYLGEHVYDPWFEEMHRRGVTLFVHPGTPAYLDPATSRTNVSVYEYMFETTRMVANLVYSGRKQRFDRIPVIAPHGGGTIPYLAHRIEIISEMPWAYRDGPRLSVADVTAGLASFYYDITAATSSAQLTGLLDLVPADRLLMGFDYPLMPAQTIAPAIADFQAYPGIDADQREKIVRANALTLFPRLAS